MDVTEVKVRDILRWEEVVQFIAYHYGEQYQYMNDNNQSTLYN